MKLALKLYYQHHQHHHNHTPDNEKNCILLVCRNKLVSPAKLTNLGINKSIRERWLTVKDEMDNRFKISEHRRRLCVVHAIPYFLPLK